MESQKVDISTADYFPYGKFLREYVGTGKERYLTTQHERDEETGLDYRGARYYDSDVARFLSLDPLAKKFIAWSAYNYVMGNPIVFVDPTGKSPEDPGHKLKRASSIKDANRSKNRKEQVESKSNDAPPKSKVDVVNLAKTVNENIGMASTIAVEGSTAYISSQFKSNTNNFTFSKLTESKQTWRTNAVLGSKGVSALKFTSVIGNVTTIATPIIHGIEIATTPSEEVSTMDYVDLSVESAGAVVVGLTWMGYLSNPIGWVAGTAVAGYSAFRYGQTHDVLEDFRAEPGLNACFIHGTKILMSNGLQKEIEKVQLGDSVLSYNFQTKKIESKKVIELVSPTHTKMVEVNFTDGNQNLNTFDHPYFVKGKGWASYDPTLTFEKYKLKVEKIENGDFCYLYENGILVETQIDSLKEVTGNYHTYNLNNVEDNNNFFANGILVHNKVGPQLIRNKHVKIFTLKMITKRKGKLNKQ